MALDGTAEDAGGAPEAKEPERGVEATSPRGPVAYSYIRFSRPEQIRGDSLDRQRRMALAWSRRRGIPIDLEMRDLGVSAYRGDNRRRGQLADFLRLVEEGRVRPGDYLLVEALDRISRGNLATFVPIFINLLAKGLIVVTLQDGREHSDASYHKNPSELSKSLEVLLLANLESTQKATRLARAWRKKWADATLRPVRVRPPAWISAVEDGDEVQYRFREGREEVVREIFRMAIEGHGCRAIARRLSGRFETWPIGEKKGPSRYWHPSYVQKILRSPASFGAFAPSAAADKRRATRRRREALEAQESGIPYEVVAKREEMLNVVDDDLYDEMEVELVSGQDPGNPGTEPGPETGKSQPPRLIRNFFPAAVDEATYNRARAAVGARLRKEPQAGPAPRVNNVLQGKAICGGCGWRMVRVNKGRRPRGREYLVCAQVQLAGAKNKSACSNGRRWPLDLAERAVLAGAGRLDLRELVDDVSEAGLRRKLREAEDKVVVALERHEAAMEMVTLLPRDATAKAVAKGTGEELEKAETARDAAAAELLRAEAMPGAEEQARMAAELMQRWDAVTGSARDDLRRRVAQIVAEAPWVATFDRTRISIRYDEAWVHRVRAATSNGSGFQSGEIALRSFSRLIFEDLSEDQTPGPPSRMARTPKRAPRPKGFWRGWPGEQVPDHRRRTRRTPAEPFAAGLRGRGVGPDVPGRALQPDPSSRREVDAGAVELTACGGHDGPAGVADDALELLRGQQLG